MKILLTGGRGMLGRTLQRVLGKKHQVIATGLPEADVTDYRKLFDLLSAERPDVVIHCAAMTQVDDCETQRVKAYKINATGSANAALCCERLGIRLIAFSTDYVFSGNGKEPLDERTYADGGETVYGQSKFMGERVILSFCPGALICRLAWLYGDGGPSFLHTVLKLADGTREPLKVVDDQTGNPTSCDAVAEHILLLLERKDLSGICHLSCENEASWYDFACEIYRLKGIERKIVPCTTAEFPRPAKRPAYSVLKKSFLAENGLPPMPDWKEALAEFFTAYPDGM